MAENFAALVPYGFTPRVHALWNDRGHEADDAVAQPGRVVRVDGATSQVACVDGAERTCRARSPVAVGDWVVLEGDVVVHVLPRWSAVTRADPAGARVQLLAANADVVVVAAPADRLKIARVEREVTFAWDSGARPLVALTKSDLDDGHLTETLRSRVAGVGVIATSVRRRRGLDELASELAAGRTGVLIGPSGAGKSTLVNALVGHDVQAIGDVRAGDRRGRHTTTARQLVCLPSGGTLIDTPGLRSLGMASAGGRGLDAAFPDVELLSRDCRFRNCTHRGEPGCAVRRAVADGSLDRARLASFEKLGREAAAERRRSDPFEARAARRMWVQRRNDARRHDKRRYI